MSDEGAPMLPSTRDNGRYYRPLSQSLLVELVQEPDADHDEPKNEKDLSDCHKCLLDGRVNEGATIFNTVAAVANTGSDGDLT
jgi:hypothetical protein